MSVLNKFISLLNIWNTGLPLQTQWVCIIHQIPNIITNSVIRQYENVPLASQGDWGTPMDLSSPDLVSGTSQSQDDSGSVTGLFFAQGIILNREFHNTREVTPHSNGPIGGYIPGIVSIGREGFKSSNLVIEIRESNLSFIDHLIRQWIVMGAHLGLVNYGAFGQQYNILNIKSTVEVRQYGKYTKSRHGKGGRPIRKRMIFYNVVPVKFESFNLTYDAEDLSKNIKTVEFTYSHYSILPPQDTINNIANLNGPTALDNQISALIDLNNVDAIASKYNSAVAQAQSQVTQQRQIALAQLEKSRLDSFVPEAREFNSGYYPEYTDQSGVMQGSPPNKSTYPGEFRQAQVTAQGGPNDPQDKNKNFYNGGIKKAVSSSISFDELKEFGYDPNNLTPADKVFIYTNLKREIYDKDGNLYIYDIDDIGPASGIVVDLTPPAIRQLGGDILSREGNIIPESDISTEYHSDTIGFLNTKIVNTYVPPSDPSGGSGPTMTDANGKKITTLEDLFEPNFEEPSDALFPK